MSKVISSLLVGIGFDVDKKSTGKVGSAIDSIKSKALQLGAVVAGAFGLKSLTNDFAESTDTLFKFSQTLGMTANNVLAFGNAFGLEGGKLESFMSQLEGIERKRAGLKVGDAGFIALSGKAKIDLTEFVKAENAIQALLSVADQFRNMDTQGRLNAASALGFDMPMIRLLLKGKDAIVQAANKQREMRAVTDEMTASAMKYNDEMQNFWTNIAGFRDTVSNVLLPKINNLLSVSNAGMSSNRDVINKTIETFTVKASRNPVHGIAQSLEDALGLIGIAPPKEPDTGKNITSAFNEGLRADYTIKQNPVDEFYYNIGDIISKAVSQVSGSKETKTIVIENNVNLDGQVIDRKIRTVVGGMADQAIQDLTSTEGG